MEPTAEKTIEKETYEYFFADKLLQHLLRNQVAPDSVSFQFLMERAQHATQIYLYLSCKRHYHPAKALEKAYLLLYGGCCG